MVTSLPIKLLHCLPGRVNSQMSCARIHTYDVFRRSFHSNTAYFSQRSCQVWSCCQYERCM